MCTKYNLLRQGGYVTADAYPSDWQQNNLKSSERILMKFRANVDNGLGNR